MPQSDQTHDDPSTLKSPPPVGMFGIGLMIGFLGAMALLFIVLISRDASQQSDPSPAASAPAQESESAPAESEALDGATIAQTVGCAACHSIDGSVLVGPSWLGLLGSTAPDGSTIDEAYLRESIVDPDASIAEGFNSGLMPPNYGSTLTDAEIDALVSYIAGLGG